MQLSVHLIVAVQGVEITGENDYSGRILTVEQVDAVLQVV
jgi:hypothetical protein